MAPSSFTLAKEVGRVPSMTVALDARGEKQFKGLMEGLIMVDLHEHPMVCTEDMSQFVEYLRAGEYRWAYDAAIQGGWAAVASANCFRGMVRNPEMSFLTFEDLVDEVGMMLADLSKHGDKAVRVTSADEILKAHSQGKVGILPTVEHLALGDVLHRVDVLHSMGVRIGGLTYNLQNQIGAGLLERHDYGLTNFGIEVVHRMNDLGMAVDVSHAGLQTALDAIEHSRAPIIYSHNASHTLRPSWRNRKDEELMACSKKGGVVAVTAVPNALSDDPKQDINCVLDHYDYLVNLVGVDHVAIGTDTLVGDHVGYHIHMMGRDFGDQTYAPYLDGLESPADGKNIVRGLIARGYAEGDIRKIVGENALTYLRRVMA
jgi:membrane dipeptidase